MRVLAALSILASFGGIADPLNAEIPVASHAWEIGPIIRGKNYSVGMPLRPNPTRSGWFLDFPFPNATAGHVHYVTFRPGSLQGASTIVVRYRIDAAPGVKFVPQERPDRPATLSVYLQRRGDTWSAKGKYEWFRWYSPKDTMRMVAPGVHEITVHLDDPQWMSVYGKLARANPQALRDAVAATERVGLVFGQDKGGRGHGVYATGPARFTLLDFQIR